jgi:RNA-directed DNA polymerase
VSAVSASPAAKGSPVAGDPVRALQHALYRAAKADPGRRFHALYDKVSRSDVLWRAWVAVRRNNGAPGIDKVTLAAVGEYGVTRLLDELAAELKEGRYRPLPARRVYIPKPVGFRNSATGPDLGFYAARSYSLMRPPRTGRRLIRSWERSATG